MPTPIVVRGAFADYYVTNNKTAFLINLEKELGEFESDVSAGMKTVAWKFRQHYNSRLPSSIRGSTWSRTGKLATQTKLGIAKFRERNHGAYARARFDIEAPADRKGAAVGLERGRAEGGSPKGKYYYVPVRSFIGKKGTPGDIKSIDDTFMLKKEYTDKHGRPIRLIFKYRPGTHVKSVRKMMNERKERGARKKTRMKRELKNVAMLVFLAYKVTTGIPGRTSKYARKSRKTDENLAKQFNLPKPLNPNAPRWFTKHSISTLSRLYYLMEKAGATPVKFVLPGSGEHGKKLDGSEIMKKIARGL